MGYIILNGKTPVEDFKNKNGKTWDEVKDFNNIGLIVPKPFVVYDFDNQVEADMMLQIIKDKGIKTRVIKTTRGIHCWFKSEKPMGCNNRVRSALSLHFDRKSHSKNAYVVVKKEGNVRETIIECKDDEIQDVPVWLKDVPDPGNRFDFVHMEDGSGRNDAFFNYILVCMKAGMSKDDIKETIHIINNYVIGEPVSERELNTILRDDSFPDKEEIKEDKKFDHVEYAKKLMSIYKIIGYHDNLYTYDNGVYIESSNKLKKELTKLRYGILDKQRLEVIKYLKIVCDVEKADYKPYDIVVNNGSLNLKNGKLTEFNDKDIVFNKLHITYDPSITHHEDIEKCLNNVFCGDEELIQLFYEMIGACLVKKTMYEKAFLFVGDGSNGKSTIIKMLEHLFEDNYSSLSLHEMTMQFKLIDLENKMVNLADDIDNIPLKHTGALKRIIGGGSVYADVKGKKGHAITPYATHIASANEIPHSSDKSYGFYRRFIIIPFNANFSDMNSDFDPFIEDKIRSEDGKSFLLNKGIEGLHRIIKNHKFTEPDINKAMMEEYKIDNSSVLSWINDEELTEDDLLNKPKVELYSDFTDWCKCSGVVNITGKKLFYREIIKQYKFYRNPEQKTDGKRYFKK